MQLQFRCDRLGLTVVTTGKFRMLSNFESATSETGGIKIGVLLHVQCKPNTRVRILYLQITAVTNVMHCSPPKAPEKISVAYKHVCDHGFNRRRSRWYSCPSDLDFVTLEVCRTKENAVVWRKSGNSNGACVMLHQKSNAFPVGKGKCYLLDKVVPLGSLHPPPWIVTKHNPQDLLSIG
jgi:hypothetical protein